MCCVMCLIVVFCQGCASIFCGSSRTVTIKSEPAEAKFTIKDKDGIAIHTGITPSTVSLKRGSGYFKAGDYSLIVEKEGYVKGLTPIKTSIEWGWYGAGNIVVGGLIGWVIIDPITGGMYKIEDTSISLVANSSEKSSK